VSVAGARGKIDIYLELGQKRVFAGALDWPGWCRPGKDEASALQSLLEYAPRYARVVRAARLDFETPTDPSAFRVSERLKGNATTDFGAPDAATSGDARPIQPPELEQLRTLLRSCWKAFDAALSAAQGKELRKGPRGGGRDREKILRHVLESDGAYLSMLGWKLKQAGDPQAALSQTRSAILEALESVAPIGVPEPGPRGGARWPARYFVRRVAWHVLDHAWELEDRAS
jgi:hypothetical protein